MKAWTCRCLCMHVYQQVLGIKCNRKEAQVLWCQRRKEVIEIRFMEKKLCNNFKLTQIPWGLEDTYLKTGIVLLPKSGYHLRCTKKSKHKDIDRYNDTENPHFKKKGFLYIENCSVAYDYSAAMEGYWFWTSLVLFYLKRMDLDRWDVFWTMDFELFYQLLIIGGEKFLHIWNQHDHITPDS